MWIDYTEGRCGKKNPGRSRGEKRIDEDVSREEAEESEQPADAILSWTD